MAQFHQPHNLFSRARLVLDEELPGVVDRLVEAGCVWIDPLAMAPPSLDKTPQRGRRPVPVRHRAAAGDRGGAGPAAAEEAGVDVRRGVAGAGLLTAGEVVAGVPHVVGVRTTDGDELAADLVVDATGRRTRLAEWLAAVGARPPYVETEDTGFVYHTRYFTGPRLPRMLGPPVAEIGTISLLTIPGDNGTWSVTVWAASADTALRGLKDPDRFTAVVKACPLQAGWVRGEPITDVLTMAGVLDRYRRFVVDGQPVATGVVAVGRRVGVHQPVGRAGHHRGPDPRPGPAPRRAVAGRGRRRGTGAGLRPGDRGAGGAVLLEPDHGRPSPDGGDGRPPPGRRAARPRPDRGRGRGAPSYQDPDVFRGSLETAMCLALPEEVFARPGFMDRVRAVTPGPPMRMPGPDRTELLELLA